jgi:curli production assembly/transport component CsgF
MSHRILFSVALSAAILGASAAASADELTYTPINPSFGGNPFNSSHLLGTANAQNDYTAPSNRETQSEQFIRMLQSRLLTSLAAQVSDAILGDNAQPTGEIIYGTQTVRWETLLDSIRLTIIDTSTGAETEIVIPSPLPIG